jgi:hypothetical protein
MTTDLLAFIWQVFSEPFAAVAALVLAFYVAFIVIARIVDLFHPPTEVWQPQIPREGR